jgi:hypothetical protein
MDSYTDFLTPEGHQILQELRRRFETKEGNSAEVMILAILANSLDTYRKAADICNKYGHTQKPKEGGWDQVRPEYTVMRNEYANIMKHAAKLDLLEVPESPTKKTKGFDLKVLGGKDE